MTRINPECPSPYDQSVIADLILHREPDEEEDEEEDEGDGKNDDDDDDRDDSGYSEKGNWVNLKLCAGLTSSASNTHAEEPFELSARSRAGSML
jgi:hypothetical protein